MPNCWKCETELKGDEDLCPECGANQRPTNFSDVLDVESALLDFYSDRAVAHASFLLASIFGLVTLLAIVQQMISQTSTILICFSLFPFGILAYLGYHTLRRFGAFASNAEELKEQLRKCAPKHVKESLQKRIEETDEQLIIKQIPKKLRFKKPGSLYYLAYWLLIVSLSCVVYLQSKDIIITISLLITIGVLAIAIFCPFRASKQTKEEISIES